MGPLVLLPADPAFAGNYAEKRHEVLLVGRNPVGNGELY